MTNSQQAYIDAFLAASQDNNQELANTLLATLNVNAIVNDRGDTVLMALLSHEKADLPIIGAAVGLILSHPQYKPTKGDLKLALDRGNDMVASQLLEKMSTGSQSIQISDDVFKAIEKDMKQTVECLLKTGRSMGIFKEIEGKYFTPLMYAFEQKKTEMVNLLLDNGANPKDIVVSGKNKIYVTDTFEPSFMLLSDTVLNHAVRLGDIEILRKILSKTNDVNFKGKDNATALFSSVSAHKVDIAKLLLEKGADPKIEGVYFYEAGEMSPLHVCLLNEQTNDKKLELAKLLIKHGAKVDEEKLRQQAANVHRNYPEELLVALKDISNTVGGGGGYTGKEATRRVQAPIDCRFH